MIKTFPQKFRNLQFRKKILGISLFISLIPVLLLGLFSYIKMRSLLIEREETALAETLHQEAVQLNYKLDSYLSTVNFIAWNENIRTALSREYESGFDMYLVYRDTIDPLFLTLRSLNTDIRSITIYTDVSIYPHGNTLRPLSEIQDRAWYRQASDSTAPFFYPSVEEDTLYLICQMYYLYVPHTNIICMAIDLPAAMSSAQSLFDDNYGFLLTDSEGNTLYQYSNPAAVAAPAALSFQKLLSNEVPGCISEQEALSGTDWTVFLYRPTASVSAAAHNISYIVLAMAFLCILLIFAASTGLSRLIVSPIERLSSDMKLVEQGNYEITVASDSTDEVGQLIHSFRNMVATINNLVNEVLRAQIRQQKSEIEILQSQINPHFLYNCLSLINGKAIMSGQNDISQMAQLLSTFYRTMLNKGRQVTTVQGELENTKSYIAIQQIMHSQSFDVVYDIDPDLLRFQLPCLLLQPLAENAILHGLDHRTLPGRPILSLSCYQENQDIIFKVMDNGCGMTEAECGSILTAQSRGYGVRNVHQRVRLCFGEEYGLTFRSTKGMGTCAILRIPQKSQL